MFTISQHTIQASHIREYPRATSTSQTDPLLLHVKQYVPAAPPQKGHVTIIGAHANGFPKELYEPLWEDLLRECQRLNLGIRAILIADCAWQGRSGVLNRHKLGNDPAWFDYSRDILHLINHFRPPPPLVGIGHSFGATALLHTSLLHPRLFSSLVIIDPVLSRTSPPAEPIRASARRRESWPSREAAADAFRAHPFYRSWDSRVLQRWIDFGIIEEENNHPGDNGSSRRARLTTSKHQEIFTFARPDPSGSSDIATRRRIAPEVDPSAADRLPLYRYEPADAFRRLPRLRSPVCFVFGADSNVCSPKLSAACLSLTGSDVGGSGGVAAGHVRAVTEPGVGHLVPFERPGAIAAAAASWIRQELESWWLDETEFEAWSRKSEVDKTTMSSEFLAQIAVMSSPPEDSHDKHGLDKAKL